MVYKLFVTLIGSMAISITPWSLDRVRANPTEYIFTAPPEIDRELVEIPASETEYPLYECKTASSDADTEAALDSHDCNCIDCEELAEDTQSNSQLTLQNKPSRE